MSASGTLFVVATPIGNRGDLSARAREVLAGVDLVAAEDTRHTGSFLAQLGIARPLLSLHEHNEAQRVPELVERLIGGARIALVSDAGTPLVSDPGYRLVVAAGAAGVAVVPIPGACAAIAALSVAGLPTDRFAFEGFLPARGPKRRARLAELATELRTLVLYESPHRLADTLADLAAAFGEERPAVLARELTKLHESIYRNPLGALAAAARADANMTRGEAVIAVAGAPAADPDAVAPGLADRLLAALLSDLPLSRAVDVVATATGERRNRVYERALSLKRAEPATPGDSGSSS
ncbi:MAG TPA: 16S rRNA (cytidine(1402)-2'-O)-methyltransferase [Steroidobacteraceae bacterium]|nr:16S rRNA (cytidine(1402)-2'-O)-methyltransferase [Steroidobacteraceae bacterium]